MKTAEEILFSITNREEISIDECLDAMKLYAEQFIDLAAEKAEIDVEDEDRYVFEGIREPYMGHSVVAGDGRDGNVLAYINKYSILDIKKLIK